jgi:hypothetical protein
VSPHRSPPSSGPRCSCRHRLVVVHGSRRPASLAVWCRALSWSRAQPRRRASSTA